MVSVRLCQPPGFQGVRATELFTKTRHRIHVESRRSKHRGTTQGQVGRGVPETERLTEIGMQRSLTPRGHASDAAWVTADLSRHSPTHLCIRLRGGEARVPRVRSLNPALQIIACTRLCPGHRALGSPTSRRHSSTPPIRYSADKVLSLMHLSPEGQRQGVSPSLLPFQLCHQNARRRCSPASRVLEWGGPGQRA